MTLDILLYWTGAVFGIAVCSALNSSERGEAMQTAIGAMDDALSSLENADMQIQDAIG